MSNVHITKMFVKYREDMKGRCIWKDSIKLNLLETGCETAD
jgi:hypothetical protein